MKQKKDALFSGAASELLTPFTPAGDIDYALLEGEIEYVLGAGIEGLYINGYQTEYLQLCPEEREAVTRFIVGRVRGRVPIMGNILADSLWEGRALAARYRALGLDAIVLFTPFLFPMTPEIAEGLYSGIAAAGGLPAYICNAPNRNKLSPKQIAALCKKVPGVIGCKDATRNVLELQQLLELADAGNIEVMAGSDSQITVTMLLGGLGIFSLLSTLCPDLIVATVRACERGDAAAAIALQAKVNRLREAVKIGPFMAAYKHVAQKLGHPLGTMRPPFTGLREAEVEKVDALMQAEGMY